MIDSAPLLLESRHEVGVYLVRINRPDKRNALNLALRQALAATFERLADDAEVRCVVITGEGSCFVVGADVREMQGLGPYEVMERDIPRYWRPIVRFPKPLIAAVNGPALGGGMELALQADIILASDTATFGQPEIRLGLMPGAGGTQQLVRALGRHRAMRMLFTGEAIDARTAHEAGLVSEIVVADQLLDHALGLGRQIAVMPRVAVKLIKEVALAGLDLPLDAALSLERKAHMLLYASPDLREGLTAFIEKRAARFE